ncbi:MAG: hypothetical protein R3A10_13910 [Caldilineaceae bacterium]
MATLQFYLATVLERAPDADLERAIELYTVIACAARLDQRATIAAVSTWTATTAPQAATPISARPSPT